MNEQLTIKNFGPIQDVTAHFGKFSVLAVQQATRKTTIAKLRSTCRYFNYDSFVVNTHSPYVLLALNNALYAYQVAQASYHGHVQVVRDRPRQLSPAGLSAYLLHSNGLCEDMMDRDEQLNRTELVEEVSQELNKAFNTLLDREYHA